MSDREIYDDLFEPFDPGEPPPEESEPAFEPAQPAAEEPIALPRQLVSCPSCGAANAATGRHCEQCGARLEQGALPVAPQPLIRTTAGARALIVLAGVIAAVALVSLIWLVVQGDDEEPGDAGATSTTVAGETEAGTDGTNGTGGAVVPGTPLVPLQATGVTASSELTNFPATNLIDDDPLTEWQDAGQQGAGAFLTFTFDQPVAISQIVWQNLEDPVRFKRNFRVQGYRLRFNDIENPIIGNLADTMNEQVIDIAGSAGTQTVTIEVVNTFAAEPVGENPPFTELVIQDLVFLGQPATP